MPDDDEDEPTTPYTPDKPNARWGGRRAQVDTPSSYTTSFGINRPGKEHALTLSTENGLQADLCVKVEAAKGDPGAITVHVHDRFVIRNSSGITFRWKGVSMSDKSSLSSYARAQSRFHEIDLPADGSDTPLRWKRSRFVGADRAMQLLPVNGNA